MYSCGKTVGLDNFRYVNIYSLHSWEDLNLTTVGKLLEARGRDTDRLLMEAVFIPPS
jgi:hypothetical protein